MHWPVYKESFAVGGTDGTIAKYFKQPKYKGRILGKTGYIKNVRAFSGLCSTAGGDYLFCILTTGGTAKVRTAINDIAKAIVDSAESDQ